MNKNHGFSLIGTLVGAVIFTTVLGGSAKFVEITLQSSNTSKAILTENDFKQTIAKGLTIAKDSIKAGCSTTPGDASLKPKELVGSDRDDGIGTLKDGFELPGGIKKGDFKGSIEVVKMELRGVATESKRDFVVYYKMKFLGNLNARDPLKCTNTDVTGCFEHSCQVTYDRTNKHCKSSDICQVFAGGGGGGPPPCYQADNTNSSGQEAQTLVGCGGANESAGTKTVAIGYGAGKANTGTGNTFIGYKTGLTNTGSGWNTFLGSHAGQITTGNKNTFIGFNTGERHTSGGSNTFIGASAGITITTGGDNIAIGHNVQLDNPIGDHQINIGNIIKAKRKPDGTKKMGVLKICNPKSPTGDGKCIELSKKSLSCPENQYFRGFNDDGTPLCQQERCTPQSGLYFWKPEDQCHHCPRASPLYVNVLPAHCTRPTQTVINNKCCQPCPSNTSYRLSSNFCRPNCPSYQTLIGGSCRCPALTPHHYGGKCNRCPSRKPHFHSGKCNRCEIWRPHYYDKNCHRCESWRHYHYGGKCNRCPSWNPHFYNHRCHRCEYRRRFYYEGRCNKCRQGKYYYTSVTHPQWGNHCWDCPENRQFHYIKREASQATCNKCQRNKQYEYEGGCHRCPRERRYYYSNDCNKCPEARKHYYNRTCNRCYMGQNLIGNKCKCPSDKPHLYRKYISGNWMSLKKCHKCIRSQYDSNGLCCHKSPKTYNTGGICCPRNYKNSNGSCVPRADCRRGYTRQTLYEHPTDQISGGVSLCCPKSTVLRWVRKPGHYSAECVPE